MILSYRPWNLNQSPFARPLASRLNNLRDVRNLPATYHDHPVWVERWSVQARLRPRTKTYQQEVAKYATPVFYFLSARECRHLCGTA